LESIFDSLSGGTGTTIGMVRVLCGGVSWSANTTPGAATGAIYRVSGTSRVSTLTHSKSSDAQVRGNCEHLVTANPVRKNASPAPACFGDVGQHAITQRDGLGHVTPI